MSERPSSVNTSAVNLLSIKSAIDKCASDSKLTLLVSDVTLYPVAMAVDDAVLMNPSQGYEDICRGQPVALIKLRLAPPKINEQTSDVERNFYDWWVARKMPAAIELGPAGSFIIDGDEVRQSELNNATAAYEGAIDKKGFSYGTPLPLPNITSPFDGSVVWLRWFASAYMLVVKDGIVIKAMKCTQDKYSCWARDRVLNGKLDFSAHVHTSSSLMNAEYHDQLRIIYPQESIFDVLGSGINYVTQLTEAPSERK